jgi:hypothetical protein
MDAHVQTLIAAAAGRARMLLEILDVEHTTEQLHQRARAVRTELDAIAKLAGEHPPPPLPGPARPSGEQLGLDT